MSEYDDQAQAFVASTGITINAVLRADRCPIWAHTDDQPCNFKRDDLTRWQFPSIATDDQKIRPCKCCKTTHGDRYIITISRKNKSISFDYWNSANDAFNRGKRHNIGPSNYDILACISSDASFADATAESLVADGILEDKLESAKRADGIIAHGRKITSFFSREELEALSEIQ